ncbi:hypothetical protein [Pleionea litopenaei]|uniref:Uncharacterized protein n=1 Tax=Pleionea litopenaei TaxID=3070815 RepID=A0AA51RWI5_9GAMM|nr:hypothetical protein [Pleionea sp. HL-JVS1]WMS88738.1 hypothetical protein Q9312_07425 [Pleionea sp. HL-JVS1]
MKKEFVRHFKDQGYRINSSKGEAFKKNGDIHYFLRIFSFRDIDDNESLYFKFGVNINSPFEPSYWPFENSVYLGEFCYGGERTDEWRLDQLNELISVAEEIAVPWIEENMNLDVVSNHIRWLIDNGIRWLEPPQFKSEQAALSHAGQQIEMLGGGPGNKICHNWVKRLYKPLAIVQDIAGCTDKAIEYINLYLEHISTESFRTNEIECINNAIQSGNWPKSS